MRSAADTHIDHIGGIMDADNKPLFANAEIWLSPADCDFWTHEGKLGTPLKAFVDHARKNLLPVHERVKFFGDGQEFLPSAQAIAAPGHFRTHDRHYRIRRQDFQLPRRPGASSDPAARKADDGVRLRQRPETIRQDAGQVAHDAGGEANARDVVPHPLAGLRQSREGGRRVQIRPSADKAFAVIRPRTRLNATGRFAGRLGVVQERQEWNRPAAATTVDAPINAAGAIGASVTSRNFGCPFTLDRTLREPASRSETAMCLLTPART